MLGADVNNSTFSEIVCGSTGYNLYGSGPFPGGLKGAVAFWSDAQVGSRWLSCTADTTVGGRGAYVTHTAGLTASGVFMGLHDEGALGVPHFGGGTVIGGFQTGYTDNTEALVITQAAIKNFYTQEVKSRLPGVLAELQLPGNGDASGVGDGVLAGGTSDVAGQRWNLHYGANLLPSHWGWRFAQEQCFFAFTVTGAETGDGELNGPSVLWMPQGAFRGSTAGGYPDWYEFTGPNETTSTYVRSGKRRVGDRYRTPDVISGLGSVVERVVVTDGYDARPSYPGGSPPPVVATPGDGVNSWSWRATAAGQQHKVFRATIGGMPAGLGEPDVSGALVPGDTVGDGAVTWTYIGDAPVFGSVVLGATVSGTDPGGAGVDLTDDVRRELALVDERAYSLRVSVVGRDRATPSTVGRHVYELLATATAGALTIVDPAPPPAPIVGLGTLPAGWDISVGTSGLVLRVTCTGAVGAVVDFSARIEAAVLGSLA